MGSVIAGRYRLEVSLGHSGMKESWRAVRVADGTRVVVSVMRHVDSTRFLNELQLVRRVEHPQVARVLDGGITGDGEAYVASEWLEGSDLATWLRGRGPLPPGQAADLFLQLAAGLEALHAAMVIHRDLAPHNAIVTAAGIKLIGAGISQPSMDPRTGFVPVSTALPYMARETFTKEGVDGRTDVYALGVLFHEILTGRHVIEVVKFSDLVMTLTSLEAHDLQYLSAQPPLIRALVGEMLAVARDRRPSSTDVVRRLRAALAAGQQPVPMSFRAPSPRLGAAVPGAAQGTPRAPSPTPASFVPSGPPDNAARPTMLAADPAAIAAAVAAMGGAFSQVAAGPAALAVAPTAAMTPVGIAPSASTMIPLGMAPTEAIAALSPVAGAFSAGPASGTPARSPAALASLPQAPVVPHTPVDRRRYEPGESVGPLRLRLRIPLGAPVTPNLILATPWSFAPYVALIPHGGGSRVVVFDPDGRPRWSHRMAAPLEGGFVADLDGDGVGELILWGRDLLLAFDAAARPRFQLSLPALTAPWPGGAPPPWEIGGLTPTVTELPPHGRVLLAGGKVIDGAGRILGDQPSRFQGTGTELRVALGSRGFSVHGVAGQAFRGDCATAAALLLSRGQPAFHIAHLEVGPPAPGVRGGPAAYLSVYGPGGRRVSAAHIGTWDFPSAPLEMALAAQRPDFQLFDAVCAPLAVLGETFTVVVPFLTNAPWFGPSVVAIDPAAGADRWRRRTGGFSHGGAAFPPLLADLDGAGGPELVFANDFGVVRFDIATGTELQSLPIFSVPVAVADPEGRGRSQVVMSAGDAIEVWEGTPCLPGLIQWIPPRGDLWRSGSVGPDGLPIGPRS